ncbi:hypothetical protein TREMEDRAFT_38178 [Tremella mesenterica DSM 1558]|nr:uncharacterized protein TREMEDRAFT_38178 [Tremella mesenterica DSM 1558]EIW70435.1 hypothetical protein TREMEDRAFT_38178 [Tremella mesenterica DSM 1558]
MNICTEKPANLPKLGEIGLEADASSGFGRKRSTAGSARPVGLGMTRPLPSQGMGTFNMGNMGSFASGPLRAADRNRPSRVPSQGPLTPMISRGVARGSQRGTRRQPPPPADDASPLVVSANSWSAQRPSNDEGSPAYVERKVKALLNKLTAEKFDSIAQQILEWANKSEHETDGTSLKLVIKLVFEKATDEAHWSQMYARLCRLILERLNPNVSETVEDGKVISGGVLFRRYLIGRCQVDFENGWKAREDTATAAAARSEEDKQQLANREGDEAPMLSDEYYAAQKAKRRGLGLVQLIGELYKLEMISRNVIRQCLRRLLGNLDSPDEEDIESTCKLLTTIGGQYDEVEKDNMDVIFDRLSVILKGDKLPSRIRFMIMDVFDLRRSGWQSRKPQSSVMTIAEVHEQAAREQAEKSAALSRDAISRGGSRAGGRRDGPQTGEWQNVPTGRPPQRPTDFSNLGKLSSQTMPNAPSFTGPSGIFARKGKTSLVTPPMSRQASTADLSNKFNVLSGEAADKAEPKQEEPQRKKITLKPRTKPMPNEEAEAGEVKDEAKEMETTSDEESGMSEQQALDKIELDMKELWGDKGLIGTRNPSDIVEYFRALPTQHHLLLATRLLDHLFRTQKTKDGEIIASGWKKSIEERVISPELLLKSVESRISTLDDDAVDFPAAYKAVALLVRSIAASPDDLERLVSLIIVEGTPRLTPRMKWEKALREVDEASA